MYVCFSFPLVAPSVIRISNKFSRLFYELFCLNHIVWNLLIQFSVNFQLFNVVNSFSSLCNCCFITRYCVLFFCSSLNFRRRDVLWKTPQRSLDITGLKVGPARYTQRCLLSSLVQGLLLNFHANQRLKRLLPFVTQPGFHTIKK